jgi:uncharacterized repeat protein (TIGR01451 family)
MIRNRFELSSIITKFFVLIFIIVLTPVSNAASLDPSPIVNGISSICPRGIADVAGIPGPIEIFSSSEMGPVPIVSGDEDANPSFAVVGVASTSGNGRIVALGHDGFFINFAMSLQDFDNEKFGINIINWLQNSQSNKKVLITTGHGEPWVGGSDYEDFRNALKAQGYDVVITPGKITSDTLSGASILFMSCAGPSLADDEIGYIRSFVNRGGGLFMQGLGWSWVQYQHLPLEDCPMNKLAKPYGFRWIDGYISDSQHNYNGAPIFPLFYPARGKLLNVPYFSQGGTGWCWANAFSMILKYYGKPDHAWDLAGYMGFTRNQGFNDFLDLFSMKSYFSSKGLNLFQDGSLFDPTKEMFFNHVSGLIDSYGSPIAISYNYDIGKNHFIVVVGYAVENNNKFVYIHDPQKNWMFHKMSYDNFFNDYGKMKLAGLNSYLYYIRGIYTPNPGKAALCIIDSNLNSEEFYYKDTMLNKHNVLTLPHRPILDEILESNIIFDKGIKYRRSNSNFIDGFSVLEDSNIMRFYNKEMITGWRDTKKFVFGGKTFMVSNPTQVDFNGKIKIFIRAGNQPIRSQDVEVDVLAREFVYYPDGDVSIDLNPIEHPGPASIEIYLLENSGSQVDKIGPINFEIKFPSGPQRIEFTGSKTSNAGQNGILGSGMILDRLMDKDIALMGCPIDLKATDPDGLIISKQSNEIPESKYVEKDINEDNITEEIVSILEAKEGIYSINAKPKANSSQNDIFNINIYFKGKVFNLVKDIKIKDIPAKPYLIEVTKDKIVNPIMIDKNASKSSAAPGSLINFVIDVTNTGTMPLNQLRVVDHLPDGLSYVSDNRSGSASGRTIIWNTLPSLNVGESISIELAARIDPDASGKLTNLAEATAIRSSEKQEEVSNSGYSTVRVVDVKELKVRQNVERAKIGDQVAMATGNGRATNNIKVVSD